MRSRSIIASGEFERCVSDLGGWRAVDPALEPIIEGLRSNPYGYKKVENDHVSFRYAYTKATRRVPAMIVVFTIDMEKNVVLQWCEENSV